jgi:hypothetical protein
MRYTTRRIWKMINGNKTQLEMSLSVSQVIPRKMMMHLLGRKESFAEGKSSYQDRDESARAFSTSRGPGWLSGCTLLSVEKLGLKLLQFIH